MARVRLNEPRPRRAAGVQLLPGLQSVPDERWAELKRHPIVRVWIERGILEELKAKAKARAKMAPGDVAEIYDMAALRALLDDSDPAVAGAAQAQIDRIDAQAK